MRPSDWVIHLAACCELSTPGGLQGLAPQPNPTGVQNIGAAFTILSEGAGQRSWPSLFSIPKAQGTELGGAPSKHADQRERVRPLPGRVRAAGCEGAYGAQEGQAGGGGGSGLPRGQGALALRPVPQDQARGLLPGPAVLGVELGAGRGGAGPGRGRGCAATDSWVAARSGPWGCAVLASECTAAASPKTVWTGNLYQGSLRQSTTGISGPGLSKGEACLPPAQPPALATPLQASHM